MGDTQERELLGAGVGVVSDAELVVGDKPIGFSLSIMQVVNQIVKLESFTLPLVEVRFDTVLANATNNPGPVGASVKDQVE